MELKNIIILIPAYNPPIELISFTTKLLTKGFSNILIVNDGSSKSFEYLFNRLKKTKAIIITHEKNIGKGEALKTGLKYCLKNHQNINGVITADADGQHTIEDITTIAIQRNKNELILGKRLFNKKDIPFKSKLGNFLSRKAISFVIKQKIYDTQTGLRFIPYEKLKSFSTLPGIKYEYETNMLLYAKKIGLKIKEIDIKTIYINSNKGSHFRPLKDGYRIYKSIFNFLFKK